MMSDEPIYDIEGPELPPVKPTTLALLDLFGRAGAEEVRFGYSDEEDAGLPVVWWATGRWLGDKHEAAGGMSLDDAIERLAERVIDGGRCTHCLRLSVLLLPEDEGMPDKVKGLGACYVRFRDDAFISDCRRRGPAGS